MGMSGYRIVSWKTVQAKWDRTYIISLWYIAPVSYTHLSSSMIDLIVVIRFKCNSHYICCHKKSRLLFALFADILIWLFAKSANCLLYTSYDNFAEGLVSFWFSFLSLFIWDLCPFAIWWSLLSSSVKLLRWLVPHIASSIYILSLLFVFTMTSVSSCRNELAEFVSNHIPVSYTHLNVWLYIYKWDVFASVTTLLLYRPNITHWWILYNDELTSAILPASMSQVQHLQ